MPKVSVIVPVYNVEKYLPQCLESLVNQTLSDIEIIVVNDGATDNSQSIIDTFAEKHPNIKAFTKKNGGLSDARNFGIKKATGDFIGFVDGDDFVDVTMFEKLYNRAIETYSDIVVCDHNSVVLNYNSTVKTSTLHKIQNGHLFGKSIYESHGILAFARSYAWNKLYKREIIKNFEFPKGQHFEDSAVVYNILSLANRVEYLPEALYFYVVGRAGAITNSCNNRMYDIFKSCDSIINHYQKIGQYEELKSEIESLCLMHIHARFAILRTKGGLARKFKFVDTAFDYIEKNFPNWQNNPYYLKSRAEKLSVYPPNRYHLARDKRSRLKKYYTCLYIRRLPISISNTLKQTSKKIAAKTQRIIKRILGIPTVSQNVRNRARQLSADELRELQLITLDILKTVVEFCDKHNLRYYLAEGSLLGAVRHGGFIPWDDDMDIAMPRQDYDKFIKLWNTKIHNDCRLFHQDTYPKYYLPFAKVILMKDCKFASLIRAGLKAMKEIKGPGIDIFPLDETGPLSTELIKRSRKVRKLRNILLTKVYYIKNPQKRKLYQWQSTINSYKTLHKKLTKILTADKGKNTEYYTNFGSAYNISKEIFPKSHFEPARTVDFEGIKVKIPLKSEEVLGCIYGDYMTLPPENARVCPHQYIVKSTDTSTHKTSDR
jgi:phosphorylcholine metabolism protein LicD/glycosyltransferase involved in cell wall biosynthesis